MKVYEIDRVRTNNFKGNVMTDIGGLWERALVKLKDNKSDVYAIYHEYESDYKGDYTLSVATVDPHSSIVIELDDSTREILPVTGINKQDTVAVWQSIWERENAGTMSRLYTQDFEVYHTDGTITVHIAVENK